MRMTKIFILDLSLSYNAKTAWEQFSDYISTLNIQTVFELLFLRKVICFELRSIFCRKE